VWSWGGSRAPALALALTARRQLKSTDASETDAWDQDDSVEDAADAEDAGRDPTAPGIDLDGSSKRGEIEALYARYNPEKILEVGALLGKYGEAKLLAMVRSGWAQPVPCLPALAERLSRFALPQVRKKYAAQERDSQFPVSISLGRPGPDSGASHSRASSLEGEVDVTMMGSDGDSDARSDSSPTEQVRRTSSRSSLSNDVSNQCSNVSV
jgi:hypothetical protein